MVTKLKSAGFFRRMVALGRRVAPSRDKEIIAELRTAVAERDAEIVRLNAVIVGLNEVLLALTIESPNLRPS